jgi:Fe-S-cluster-containing hydrogenase component 2
MLNRPRVRFVCKVVCVSDLCAGCRTCEAVCSLSRMGVVNPALSRISVSTRPLDGCVSVAYTCNQCVGPECLSACPTGAITVDGLTGAKVIDEVKCTGCRLCVEACPFTPRRVGYNPEKEVCFKCDLCGGEPRCVEYCPMGALRKREVRV